jgi:NTE family protein
MLPYRIYLSGGGVCAMAHVGALLELSKYVPLKAIKEWMGVSAGSLVSMCLCIGFTLDELLDFSIRFDFKNKGLSSDLTFKECFDKFGVSLRIIATDLNEVTPKIFSPKDTPNYKVSNAVRASMTFPYYFQPFICPETGHYLIDGGVISNYPLFILPKEEHNRTLSILIRILVEKNEKLTELGIDSLITRPLNIALIERLTIEAKLYDAPCIQVMLGQLDVLDFSLNDDMKQMIIKKGNEAVNNYFKFHPKPKRRRSIS